jgi:sugar phosphate isomerase/epimerase
MPAPGIAITLYSVREPAAADLAGTLAVVREAGWRHVQWSGMPALDGPAARAALDEAGLRAMAGHAPLGALESAYEAQRAFWQALGVGDLAVGSMPEEATGPREAWRAGLRRLEAVGRRLADDGIRFAYHNHWWEFAPFEDGGGCPLDLLMDESDPAALALELDCAWAFHGGADPAALLRRYAGRCPVIHVKDIDRTKRTTGDVPLTVALGEGAMDWEPLLAAAAESGVEWLVYEQDVHAGDWRENVARSWAFLHECVAA